MTLRGMMRAAVVGAALVIATSALSAPVEYDCDTAEGAYSQIEQQQRGPGYRVRGTVTPVLLRSHRKFLPTATVFFRSADKKRMAIVQVMRRGGKKLDVSVQTISEEQTSRKFTSSVAVREALPFDLDLRDPMNAVAVIGTERVKLDVLLGEGASLSVTCSTGQFHFSNLDWDPPL